MERTIKIHSRVYDLYNLLNAAPDKWWTQKEICEWCAGYNYVERPNDRCSEIRGDMLIINNSPEFEKIIVCKNYCFKVATEEETKHYLFARIRRIKEQVKQIKALRYKMQRDGHNDFIKEEWWESYAE